MQFCKGVWGITRSDRPSLRRQRERQSQNCFGLDSVKWENLQMPHGVATMLQVIIGSGIGAGIVTFGLNFWKGERDIRRANLERLYRAAHKYIKAVLWEVLEVRLGEFDATKDRSDIEAQA